jgi:hypothetical protein
MVIRFGGGRQRDVVYVDRPVYSVRDSTTLDNAQT